MSTRIAVTAMLALAGCGTSILAQDPVPARPDTEPAAPTTKTPKATTHQDPEDHGGQGPEITLGKLLDGVAALTHKDPASLLDVERLRRDDSLLPDALSRLDPETGLGKLLADVNFRAKTFEDETGTARVGFEYDFSKSLVSSRGSDNDGNRWDYSATFYGRGNVALDSNVNPNDFLETGIRVSFFRHSFDAPLNRPVPAAIQDQTQDFFARIAQQNIAPEDYEKTSEWQAIQERIRQILGRELLLDVGGHATLESDQEFANYQYAYGVNAGILLKEWDFQAALSRLNVFDYPFALLRVLTGEDEEFTPSGRAIPSAMIGVDLVDPQGDQMRAAIGETDNYARFRAEVSMKTLVGKVGKERIWASMNWRYYREIDAPSSIENAQIDEYSYFAARLDLPGGLFVGYATGQLPFDVNNSSVAQLGFQWSF